ncbi:MAG: hypothetical protein KJ749_08330, partial [Planctomycetes bacterium]|nr:hypothetical protein [Planctomycetota bacterium]
MGTQKGHVLPTVRPAVHATASVPTSVFCATPSPFSNVIVPTAATPAAVESSATIRGGTTGVTLAYRTTGGKDHVVNRIV